MGINQSVYRKALRRQTSVTHLFAFFRMPPEFLTNQLAFTARSWTRATSLSWVRSSISGWRGFLIRGTRDLDVLSDQSGLFSLTGQLGQELYVSVGKSNGYSSARNRGAGVFRYNGSMGEPFRPDPRQPVVYYLRKKGVGAKSLITSDYGVYHDLVAKAPLNNAPVRVDLLHRKVGKGPLEVSQVKPAYANWKSATDWSLTLKIADGGFVEENEEFPFHPPESGYRPEMEFNFHKGQTNWTTAIQKDYYIRFGDPPLYRSAPR